jgi:hypothetical protein
MINDQVVPVAITTENATIHAAGLAIDEAAVREEE